MLMNGRKEGAVFGAAPRKSAEEVSDLICPVDEAQASTGPSQCHHVLDEPHVGEDDLPQPNLVTAVVRVERIRPRFDLVEMTGVLRDLLRVLEAHALRRAFTD